MLNPDFFNTVKYNCDVSDANYWGYFSICTLLLRLRELFKIERELEPWEDIKNEEILPWIEEKEKRWRELENTQLIPIKINQNLYSPFDIEVINNITTKSGFVYGAGYTLFMKPSFFIGSIHRFEEIDGYNVYFIDKEVVRDIFSSPGMSIEKNIFIRLTDIKYRLWEKINGWFSKKGIYEIVLSEFGLSNKSEHLSEKFRDIVDKYSTIVLYHEIAEQRENILQWNEILRNCDTSKTEYILRGIKDFVADFSEKGPVHKAFIEKDEKLLGLYILSQGIYQKKILRTTLQQIEKALISNDWEKIEEIRLNEFNRWKKNIEKILTTFNIHGFREVKNLTDKIFEEGGGVV